MNGSVIVTDIQHFLIIGICVFQNIISDQINN